MTETAASDERKRVDLHCSFGNNALKHYLKANHDNQACTYQSRPLNSQPTVRYHQCTLIVAIVFVNNDGLLICLALNNLYWFEYWRLVALEHEAGAHHRHRRQGHGGAGKYGVQRDAWNMELSMNRTCLSAKLRLQGEYGFA